MNALSRIIDEVKRDATGLAVLSDWLGDGGIPVSQELAESRANVCKECPCNIRDWAWLAGIKRTIAETIRQHIEVQSKVGLRVSNESSIGLCKTCGCVLRLKVWVPIDHIEEHTKEVTMFPVTCWIRREYEDNTSRK